MKLGVGGIILKDNETLLVLRQNCSTFNDMWANPGGSPEGDESPEQTAVRELEEELGVKTRVLKRLDDYLHIVDNKLRGVFTGYLVEILEEEPRNNHPEKIKEIRYFPLSNLPKNLAPFTRKYLEVLVEEQRLQRESLSTED